jgi:hypothetical protein
MQFLLNLNEIINNFRREQPHPQSIGMFWFFPLRIGKKSDERKDKGEWKKEETTQFFPTLFFSSLTV